MTFIERKMVYSVDIYDKTGKVTSKFDLNPEIFSDEKVNPSLIHEYLLCRRQMLVRLLLQQKLEVKCLDHEESCISKRVQVMQELVIEILL